MEAQRHTFERVFQDHLGEIQRLIALHTEDLEDRLDLTQEVFIRAYSAFSQFRGESGAGTWLYRIALNVCANAARTRSRRPETMAPNPQVIAYPESLHDIVEDLAHAEEQRMLKRALRLVPAEQLVVVSLRFSDGLTLPEIAEVVGAPVETVKSRLKAALEKIQSTISYLNVLQAGGAAVFEEAGERDLEGVLAPGEEGGKIYHSLGSLYLRKGLIEAALAEWRRAQKVAPTFIDPYLATAEQYVRMDQPAKAVEALESAVGQIQSSDLHSALAQLYLDMGDIDYGMRHSMRAIDLGPASPEANFAAGRAYYKQAQLQDALRSLSDTQAAGPVEANWRKAASYLRQAIRLNPAFARAASFLAVTDLMNKQPGRAFEDAEAAVKVAEADEFVLHQTSWVHYHLRRFELAERYLRHSISLKATAEKLSLLGVMYMAQDRYEEAFLALNEAVELGADKKAKSRMWSNLAAAALRLGNIEKAVEACEEALRLDPERIHARCNLAEAYLRQQADPEQVVRLCREGLELDPEHICFHHLLAEALLRQEMLDDALAEADLALQLQPDRPERLELRAKVLSKLGRRTEADQDLECADLLRAGRGQQTTEQDLGVSS